MRDLAAGLDALGDFLVLEVQRHGHAQSLLHAHTLEIYVQDEGLGRMPLQILEHDLGGNIADLQIEQTRVEGLFLKLRNRSLWDSVIICGSLCPP